MKRCTQCAEKVQSAALQCRFCGAALSPAKGLPNWAVLGVIGTLAGVLMIGRCSPYQRAAETSAPAEQSLPPQWQFASDDRKVIFAEVDRRIHLGTPESTNMAVALLKNKFNHSDLVFDPTLRPIYDRALKASDDFNGRLQHRCGMARG